MASPSFAQQLRVRQIDKNVFESIEPLIKMGNTLPIAYGGCAIGVAIAAAVQTVPSSVHAYSILGHFLGPAQIDRSMTCHISRIRDTKTFATRRASVQQLQDNGSIRVCLELTVDFQVKEPSSMVYGVRPRFNYASAEEAPTHQELFEDLLAKKLLNTNDMKTFEATFGAMWKWIEQKHCPEGVSGQTLGGLAKRASTTLDHLAITEKVSADWTRCREPLPSDLQTAALGFVMDAGISFLPLVHDHQFLDDAGACSTLDFALRIFRPEVHLEEWHLRERSTIVGNSGRTFSEGKMFDTHGNLVASMTQQCILRAKPKNHSSL